MPISDLKKLVSTTDNHIITSDFNLPSSDVESSQNYPSDSSSIITDATSISGNGENIVYTSYSSSTTAESSLIQQIAYSSGTLIHDDSNTLIKKGQSDDHRIRITASSFITSNGNRVTETFSTQSFGSSSILGIEQSSSQVSSTFFYGYNDHLSFSTNPIAINAISNQYLATTEPMIHYEARETLAKVNPTKTDSFSFESTFSATSITSLSSQGQDLTATGNDISGIFISMFVILCILY